MELRFQQAARPSQDIDVSLPVPREGIVEMFRTALQKEWDGFSFRSRGAVRPLKTVEQLQVEVFYRGAEWTVLIVELGVGGNTNVEFIEPYDFTTIGLRAALPVPCLNRFEQIAQKLHAATEPLEKNMRYRDLVDIYLLDTLLEHDDRALRNYVRQIFRDRKTHEVPGCLARNPAWHDLLETMLKELRLQVTVAELYLHLDTLILRAT